MPKFSPILRRNRTLQKITLDYGSIFFVLPALVLLIVFRYFPLGFAFRVSLSEYSLLGGIRGYVGLENYLKALRDPLFWNSLRVVVQYLFVKVPLQVVVALGLALFLEKETATNGFFRTLICIPMVLSLIVVSVIWTMIYHSEIGLLNSFLSLFRIGKQTFLTNPGRAMPSIAIMVLWKDLGLSMLIFLSGLKGIPTMYYEAAQLDGASRWKSFWHVTIPLLSNSFLYVLLTESVASLQVFAPIFATTKGGPLNSTRAIVYYIYENGFLFGEMGYASALSVLLLILVFVLGLFQMFIIRKQHEY